MTYTGDVTPGGPSDVRELPHLTIRKMSVSEMHNNVYLLTCPSTGEQLLIDAADDLAVNQRRRSAGAKAKAEDRLKRHSTIFRGFVPINTQF